MKILLKQNKLIHSIFFNKIFIFTSLKLKTRGEIFKTQNNSDNFDQFLFFSMRFLLPKIYLEGFKKSISQAEVIISNFPKLENIISEAWISDSPSSFLLAFAKTKGINHYCNEHNSLTHPFVGDFLKLSVELSDYFMTLGWKSGKHKIIKSSSLYRFRLESNTKKNNKILFVAGPLGRNFPIYSSCYGSCGYFSNHIINFNKQFFIKAAKLFPSDIVFRNYPKYKSEQIKLLNPIYNDFIEKHDLEMADLTVDCLTQMSQSKLIVIDYVSTSFLEALVSNYPVIICLTKGYVLEKRFSTFFDGLLHSGIMQTDPEQLANFIHLIKDNPNKWWNSKNVQQSRTMFLNDNFGVPELIIEQIHNISNSNNLNVLNSL